MLKPLLVIVGCLSLALGAVGIVLPVLPTTPFLLLSAFCFARSSDRLLNYLLNHRVFGTYVSNYYHGSMRPQDKARTLILLWIGIGLSVWLMDMFWPGVMTVLIACAVSIHILRLKPRPDKAPPGTATPSHPPAPQPGGSAPGDAPDSATPPRS